MHSRRTFFGILTGLAALLPLPAWARFEGSTLAMMDLESSLGDFHTPSHDTSFLELPQSIHIHEWDQPMVLAGRYQCIVRRIKIRVPSGTGDLPVMFDVPEDRPPESLAGSVLQSDGAGEPPRWVPRKPRRVFPPQFGLTEDGYIDGETRDGTPDPDVLTNRLADVLDADNRDPNYVADGYPLWATIHEHGQPVKHMMVCTPYQLGVDGMRLLLLATMGRCEVFREPPCPHDAGEDGPWKANEGLWQPRGA